MIKRFLLRLMLYCVPVFGPLLLIVGLAVYSGEAMPLAWVLRLQSGDYPILYQTLDIQRTFAYKITGTRTFQPDLVFIGSSRIGQFGASLATEPDATFYNAHGVSWSTWQAWQYIESLDSASLPDVIIIDFYAIQFPIEAPPVEFDTSTTDMDVPAIFARTTGMINRVRDGYVSPMQLIQREAPVPNSLALGALAIEEGRGYWNDGSWQASVDEAQGVSDRNLDAVLLSSRNYSTAISVERLHEVEQLLQVAEARGVYVIGLVTPYSPALYEALGDNDWITSTVASIAPIFAQYDQPFFDFSHIEYVPQASVAEMRDVIHASRQLSLRIYLEMLKALPDVLGQYSDVDVLQARLENQP